VLIWASTTTSCCLDSTPCSTWCMLWTSNKLATSVECDVARYQRTSTRYDSSYSTVVDEAIVREPTYAEPPCYTKPKWVVDEARPITYTAAQLTTLCRISLLRISTEIMQVSMQIMSAVYVNLYCYFCIVYVKYVVAIKQLQVTLRRMLAVRPKLEITMLYEHNMYCNLNSSIRVCLIRPI